MLTTELIERVLETAPLATVGLIGDLFLDRYLDIDAALNEPSVETGLTAYQVTRVRSYPGALGTVLNNLAALGVGRIVPVSVVGVDGEGFELRQALERTPGVVLGHLIAAPNRRTPTYTKPMVTDGGATRELNRLDIKNRTPTPTAVEDEVLGHLHRVWPQVQALLVLDQVSEANCGVVTDRVRDHLARLAANDPAKFVLADSRERIGLFRNLAVKPNETECVTAVWEKPPKRLTEDDAALATLDLARMVNGPVFCTRGPEGIVFVPKAGPDGFVSGRHIPAYPVAGPIDVCGAGDSCSAGIACAMVAGATHEQAAGFGNLIASITVQQVGTTGTATPDQVRGRWREVQKASGGA
jgi:bifunctional ADP-heptose synthase (sugar kinase/adenylyltransferase)